MPKRRPIAGLKLAGNEGSVKGKGRYSPIRLMKDNLPFMPEGYMKSAKSVNETYFLSFTAILST